MPPRFAHQAPPPWEWRRRVTTHESPLFTIHRDEVLRPDGRHGYVEYHEANRDGVVTIARRGDGRIALVRYVTYVHGEVVTPPGGGIEPGESPLEAGRRELREEAGVIGTGFRHLATMALMTRSTSQLHIYAATVDEITEQELSGNETGMTVEWWQPADAVRTALEGGFSLAGAAAAVLMYGHLEGTS